MTDIFDEPELEELDDEYEEDEEVTDLEVDSLDADLAAEDQIDDDSDDSDSSDPIELPESDELDGISLEWEDRPVKAVREYRRKVELAWEEYLSLLTKPENAGRTIRVFSFSGEGAKKSASARARSIRARLVRTQPTELYEITADEVDSEVPVYNVYASYLGEADEATVAHRLEVHEARMANGKRVAAARVAARESVPTA